MNEFPTEWQLAKLSELCTRIVDGSHAPPRAVEKGFPMLSARNIQNRRIVFDDFRSISSGDFEREHARTNIISGDILITIVGTIGRTAVVPTDIQPFVLQRSVAVLKPLLVDPRYLSYVLESPTIQKILELKSSGTAQQGIYLKTLSHIEVPIAPLKEQKRIADKLDTLFAQVDACRIRLNRIPALLKRFRQAVLAAATSGELIIKESNRLKDTTWVAVRLEQVITYLKTGPFGTALHKVDYVVNGIPVVNPMHINAGQITPTDGMTVSEEKAQELQEFRLKQGDVVLARRGVMGRCAVVGAKEAGWLCGSGSMFMRPADHVLSEYLQIFLSSPESVKTLEADAVGSTMVNLNQKILLGLEMRLPSLVEQKEIVQRVESLFAYADLIEARYHTAYNRLEQIVPSLLTKAFRGELVPHDPDDEPPSVLLERIRALWAAQPAKPKGVSKSRKTTMTKITRESVKAAIEQLSKNMLSFDELYKRFPADYDSLRDIIFMLLDETEPSFVQVFDQETKTIRFSRRHK